MARISQPFHNRNDLVLPMRFPAASTNPCRLYRIPILSCRLPDPLLGIVSTITRGVTSLRADHDDHPRIIVRDPQA